MELQEVCDANASWSKDSVPTLTAFGSDLGITARYISEHGWPAELVEGRRPGGMPWFGNGQKLRAIKKKIDADGDLLYVRYRQDFGCMELLVWND